jgi:hypothetical protein
LVATSERNDTPAEKVPTVVKRAVAAVSPSVAGASAPLNVASSQSDAPGSYDTLSNERPVRFAPPAFTTLTVCGGGLPAPTAAVKTTLGGSRPMAGGGSTITAACLENPSWEAVTSALPMARAVTTPVASTVAISGELLAHATGRSRSALPAVSTTTPLTVAVSPTCSTTVSGARRIPAAARGPNRSSFSHAMPRATAPAATNHPVQRRMLTSFIGCR